jgi:hypothetical protein
VFELCFVAFETNSGEPGKEASVVCLNADNSPRQAGIALVVSDSEPETEDKR